MEVMEVSEDTGISRCQERNHDQEGLEFLVAIKVTVPPARTGTRLRWLRGAQAREDQGSSKEHVTSIDEGLGAQFSLDVSAAVQDPDDLDRARLGTVEMR